MIYWNDEYYYDLNDLLEDWHYDKSSEEVIEILKNKSDDWFLEGVQECVEEPLHTFTARNMTQGIDEERFSMDDTGDSQFDEIMDALHQSIDFDKLNKLMPKLWYPTRTELKFTKKDILRDVFNI